MRTAPRTALITGGGAGIGAAISRALLARGDMVISLGLAAPDWAHPNLHVQLADLSDEAATRAAAAEIARDFAVDILVHNAGVIRPALLADADPAALLDLARLHLAAPLILLQAVLPHMRAQHYGRVVLMSSRAALGAATRTAYSATKAGLIGMARTWALELAGDGITVNVVAPGPIGGTAMFHDVIPAGSAREAQLAAGIPVHRLGRPEDVARAVAFFTAEEADFLTGQTLFVCGGSSIGSLAV